MAQRTDPVEALERISWYLNFRQGDTLSLNKISEATGLAWATVQKYTKAIEIIQRLAPRISTTSEGVEVGRRTNSMQMFMADKAPSLAVYLFVQAQQKGAPTSELDISEHQEILNSNSEEIQKMESLGWIEKNEETIELTPLGVQIAGPAHSAFKNGKKKDDVVKIDRSQNRAVIDSSDPNKPSDSSRVQVKTAPAPGHAGEAFADYSQSDYGAPQYS